VNRLSFLFSLSRRFCSQVNVKVFHLDAGLAGHTSHPWWFFDQVVQDVDPTKPNYVGQGKTVADHPGRIILNMPGRPLKRRDWLHCNSMDYNTSRATLLSTPCKVSFT
jgi:hypothetical protein